MIKIIPAERSHAQLLLQNIRPNDLQEIIAATGKSAEYEIPKAIKRGGKKYSAFLADGKILAIFGIADMNGFSKIGSPWLIGSNHITTHKKAFAKASKSFFPDLIEGYDYLLNMVDARNQTSIDWLKWLGFTIYPAKPYGPYDYPFHKFDLSPSSTPQIQTL